MEKDFFEYLIINEPDELGFDDEDEDFGFDDDDEDDDFGFDNEDDDDDFGDNF